MADQPILPYYHPTTVVIVDDNDLFLHTLDLRMPAQMSYRLHHDARRALQTVNRRPALAPIPERCLAVPTGSLPWHDSTIRLDLGLIEEEIKHTERFSRTSVVIVDYAMPEMNGLEFCRLIDEPTVKKVLLTGVADERIAVDAFNEGIIDRFLPKHANGALDSVVAHAQALQRAYFLDQQRAFADTLSLTPPNFLGESALAEAFESLRTRYGIVEHYLVGDPPGLLMVSAEGRLYRWLVLSERDVEEQNELARSYGAPPKVVEDLSQLRQIGYFFDDMDGLRDDHFEWSDYLHRALAVPGTNQSWLTALIADPPIDIDFDAERSSFQSYLDRADHLVPS